MENELLVSRYQDGDYLALDELTNNNMKLMEFIAHKFSIHCNYIDYDDLIQQGWIGLLRAAQTYKSDLPNSAKFSTWAVYWVKQSMQRYLEQKTSKAYEISMEEEIGEDLKLEDTIEDPDTVLKLWQYIERRELRAELEAVMNERLSLKEREILKLKCGWDDNIEWTLESIRELYGYSTRQGVRNEYEGALFKIRRSPWGRQRIKEHLTEHATRGIRTSTKVSIMDRLRELNISVW